MTTKRHIVALLGVISVLAAIFIVGDWYTFYKCGAVESCLVESTDFQHYAKYAITVTISLVAFFVGKNSLNKRDHRLIQLAAITALLADTSFKILHNAPSLAEHSLGFSLLGISFFMIFQSIFIYRHTRTSDTDNSVPWIICIPIGVMFIVDALQLFGILGSPLVPTIAVYGAFLICSLVVGCRVSKYGYFPKKNAALIKWGMILFFLGDVFVGISFATGPDHSLQEIIATISNILIWYFYVPALVCLVLSGYKRS